MRLCPVPSCAWGIYDQNIKTIKEITPEWSLWCSNSEFLRSPAAVPEFQSSFPFDAGHWGFSPEKVLGVVVGTGEWERCILQRGFWRALRCVQSMRYHTFLTVWLFSVLNSSSWQSFKTVEVWHEPSPCLLLTNWHKQKASSEEPSAVQTAARKSQAASWNRAQGCGSSLTRQSRCRLCLRGCTRKGCKYWWSCCWFNSQPKHWLPAVPRAFPLQKTDGPTLAGHTGA